MTTGKRFIARIHDRAGHRIIDARAKAVLRAVANEAAGQRLAAYLRASLPPST